MKEYTEFEELPCEIAERPVEKRLEPWNLEEFVPVFTELGLDESGGSYTHHVSVQTGVSVVNGVQHIQLQDLEFQFTFNPEMTGSVDDSMLAGIDVELYSLTDSGKQRVFSELIYCTPDNFPSFYNMYVCSCSHR